MPIISGLPSIGGAKLPEGNENQILGYDAEGNLVTRSFPTASEIGAQERLTGGAGQLLEFDENGNVHGREMVTPNEIGAAEESHGHDASNIISGVIPAERGGTGTATGVQPFVNAAIDEHNTSSNVHTDLFSSTNANGADYATRIARLESFLYNDITANPHSMTFENLDGLVVTGVWNKTMARLEC